MKRVYNFLMARPLTKPRAKQGERLLKLRLEAGLSQVELAELIGEPQQNVAYWERSEKPPRSDSLPRIAKALGVKVEDILNLETEIPKKNGPTGRLQKIFEEVSELPRGQQQKIIEFVSAFVAQYKQVKTA
ncbi:MAG: helix-turn-helix transcriptional regulator [Candidatus Riflebacteria bacterium]|nr:helix-turn-helix transcriptional regulator [Candidatus Riflebacteria bacterium]